MKGPVCDVFQAISREAVRKMYDASRDYHQLWRADSPRGGIDCNFFALWVTWGGVQAGHFGGYKNPPR